MSTEIALAHKETIGASQAHRLMTYLQSETLPNGAMNYIQDMARCDDDTFKERYESESSKWGIENEKHAIERIQQELGCLVDDCNENQVRIYAGPEYLNFVSALPDGIIVFDGQIITVEVKCLDTQNHDYIISAVGDSSEALKREAYEKWGQVQVQNLCAENEFQQAVTSIICFFDPRSTLIDFHYVIVEPCHEFREKFRWRVKMAKHLYDSIKNESPSAPVVFDAELPKTKLVKKSENDFEITPDLLQLGLDDLVSKAAEHFGVSIKDGHFVGGDVFNCETQEGRDLAKKAKNKVTKIRTAVLKLNQPMTKELFAKYKKSLKIDQGIEEKLNGLRDHLIAPLTEWELEQERIQQAQIDAENEKKRLQEEAAEKVRQAILEKMESLKVYPCDFESLESIAEKLTLIKSISIDAMFGEFEDEARQLKENSFDFLNGCEEGIIQRKKELEEQERINTFNAFKAKCDALRDPLHSVQYLESQLSKLEKLERSETFTENYVLVKNNTIEKLKAELIPAAKQRAIDYADEQNKKQAEERKKKEANDRLEEFNRLEREKESKRLNDWDAAIVENELFDIKNSTDISEPGNFSVDVFRIIEIYAAMNPVLHQRVIDTVKAVPGYLESTTQASFLHNLFGSTKQEVELKKAFIEIIKGIQKWAR